MNKNDCLNSNQTTNCGYKKIGDIVIGGKSEYKIIYPKSANFATGFAVTEFQNFIKRATGAFLHAIQDRFVTFSDNALFISIGRTTLLTQAGIEFDYNSLNGDGFYIKTFAKSLFIDADIERGVIYGAYDFLEKFCGIKFLSYENTYVPKLNELALYSLDIKEVPDFRYRAFSYSPMDKMVYVQLYADFDNKYAIRKRCSSEGAGISMEHGGAIEWYNKIGSSHTVFEYVSPNKYFKSNPEMFATGEDGKPTDICLTNGITDDGKIDESMAVSSIKVALESLKGFIKDADKTVRFYMFGQNDNLLPCNCDKCKAAEKKFKRSGMLVRFCNVLAERAQKWAKENAPDKEVNIVFFAYTYTELAPVDEYNNLLDPSCKPKSNTVVYLAPIYANYYFSYDDAHQPDAVANIFNSWQAVHNRFFVWSYHADFNNNFWYFPAYQAFKKQLQFLKKFGTEFIFMQTCANELTNSAEPFNAYIAFKLMWNTNANVEMLREEYLKYSFGDSAYPIIKEYYDKFDEHIHNEVVNNGLCYEALGAFPPKTEHTRAKHYPYEFLKEQLQRLNKALKVLKHDCCMNNEQKNKAIIQLGRTRLIPYYMILHNFSVYFPKQITKKKQAAKKFLLECDNLGVRMYKECGYYKDFKALLGEK